MKKFSMGLVLGLIIAFSVSAFAITVGTVGYKVFVDGVEVTSDKINYNGRTYLEMRQVSEMLGARVEWNGKQADVYSKDYKPTVADAEVKVVRLVVNGTEIVANPTGFGFFAGIKNGELILSENLIKRIPDLTFTNAGTEFRLMFIGQYLVFPKNESYYLYKNEKFELKAKTEHTNLWYIQASAITDKITRAKIGFDGSTVIVEAK